MGQGYGSGRGYQSPQYVGVGGNQSRYPNQAQRYPYQQQLQGQYGLGPGNFSADGDLLLGFGGGNYSPNYSGLQDPFGHMLQGGQQTPNYYGY